MCFSDGTAPGRYELCRLAWTLSQLCLSSVHFPELCHCQQICVQTLQRQDLCPKTCCRLTLKPVLFCRCRDRHTPYIYNLIMMHFTLRCSLCCGFQSCKSIFTAEFLILKEDAVRIALAYSRASWDAALCIKATQTPATL